MASVFLKRGKYWARLKDESRARKWFDVPTGETDREAAAEFAREAQAAIDRRNADGGLLTLRRWVAQWIERRKVAVHDWKKELGRLNEHVLPVLGDVELAKITTKQIADLVRDLRFVKKRANRTVRSVYSVIKALMRDAAIDNHIPVSPCILTNAQLGSVVDKDPEWRPGALFTRDEAETMISDRHIPIDRRVTYAFGLLAGLRPGEAAALRWRNYDPTSEPLGKLTVALAYSTTNHYVKSTKTEAVRLVPVHPTLAILLAEWRTAWIVMFGREPEPDDLILPLPPETAKRRTKRLGEAFRYSDYTLRRWTDIDEKRLGWRHRSVYDTKSTFITLAIDDGADRDILRDRVTHTKPRRDAFDGYDRGPHWIETCQEVAKLRIRYLASTLHPTTQDEEIMRDEGSGGGFRMLGVARNRATSTALNTEPHKKLRTACDESRAALAAKHASTKRGGT